MHLVKAAYIPHLSTCLDGCRARTRREWCREETGVPSGYRCEDDVTWNETGPVSSEVTSHGRDYVRSTTSAVYLSRSDHPRRSRSG